MARHFIFLLLLLVVLVNGDDCDPTCEGLAPGTSLPHPYDCSKYYICLPDGSMMEAECSEGEQFDIDLGACTTGAVTCLECNPKGLCSYSCPADYSGITFRADYYNCSNYYVCMDDNKETPASCDTDTPYYNGDICTDDPSQCCDPCIAPYCPQENAMIPDLTDCKRFYLCTGVGVPDGGSLECSNGNFDLNIGSCSEDATCYEPCAPTQTPSVTPPTGSTDSPSTGPTNTPPTGSTDTPSTGPTNTPSTSTGSTDTGTPPTGSTVTPSTDSTATPPTGSTVTPSTDSTATPPTGSTVTPSTDSTATPPTGSTVTPSTDSTVIPPTDSTNTPPTGSTVTPPTGSTVIPSTDSTFTPPTDSTNTPPTDSTVTPSTGSTEVTPQTTTTPNGGDCWDSWLCEDYGYFPACTNHCSPEFFYCDMSSLGSEAEKITCNDDNVLDPDTMICVDPKDCDYPLVGSTISPGEDCLSELICVEYGYFPVCHNWCVPDFFHCDFGSLGQPADIELCTGGKLLDPDTLICVEPEDCGYPPVPQLFQTLTISPT